VYEQHNIKPDLPLVSIIILYYKRREHIEETVRSVTEQRYPAREVIVVDNHSEDGLSQLLEPLGSGIKLIELPENRGATGGRNAGIREAQGEILVFLDDDMSLKSPLDLTNVVDSFHKRPDIHVLAFRVCDPDTGELRLREWCHPRHWREYSEVEFETHWFCEGASAFRRDVFDRCGLYYEPLFYGPEGHDLAVRLLDAGFRILYCPTIKAGHRAAKEGRTSTRQYFYFTRDFIWMAYKDYQTIDGVRFLLPKLVMMLYFAMRAGAYIPFAKGLWAGVAGLGAIRQDRTPISKATVKYWSKLEEMRPGFFVRLARHRAEPQI
jgi:GT2 family glycosyltransferase